MKTGLHFYDCNECKSEESIQVLIKLKKDCVEVRIDKCDTCGHQLNQLINL